MYEFFLQMNEQNASDKIWKYSASDISTIFNVHFL
jgi:hypothetical protein